MPLCLHIWCIRYGHDAIMLQDFVALQSSVVLCGIADAQVFHHMQCRCGMFVCGMFFPRRTKLTSKPSRVSSVYSMWLLWCFASFGPLLVLSDRSRSAEKFAFLMRGSSPDHLGLYGGFAFHRYVGVVIMDPFLHMVRSSFCGGSTNYGFVGLEWSSPVPYSSNVRASFWLCGGRIDYWQRTGSDLYSVRELQDMRICAYVSVPFQGDTIIWVPLAAFLRLATWSFMKVALGSLVPWPPYVLVSVPWFPGCGPQGLGCRHWIPGLPYWPCMLIAAWP